MYYYSNLTWEQVAARMGYAWAQIHRKHKVILERLASETSGKDDIEWYTESASAHKSTFLITKLLMAELNGYKQNT